MELISRSGYSLEKLLDMGSLMKLASDTQRLYVSVQHSVVATLHVSLLHHLNLARTDCTLDRFTVDCVLLNISKKLPEWCSVLILNVNLMQSVHVIDVN